MYCPQVCLTTCVSSCPTQCCSNLEQGVNRNKVSYTMNIQCPAACYSNCLATCPVTCCNPESGKHQAISFSHRRRTGGRDIRLKSTYEGNENPLTGTSPPSSEMVRSKIVCPAICSKSCFFRCPKKCCNVRNKENIKKARTWSLAVKGKSDCRGLKDQPFKTTTAASFNENNCFKLMRPSPDELYLRLTITRDHGR